MLNRSLLVLILATMIAFTANAVLCRIAIKGGHIDPVTFSNLRLISGALVLIPYLLKSKGDNNTNWNPVSAFFLMIYAIFFSIAYINLDTGTGALLLSGTVQLTMVIHGIFKGESFPLPRVVGLFLAAGGMLVLLLPSASTPSIQSSSMMILAGFSWAAYSIFGKKSTEPGRTTAKNFLLAVPMAYILSLFINEPIHTNAMGITLAFLSGAVTSAGAYTLWYLILPKLESVTASTVQLSVPCLAILSGVLFLHEPINLRIAFSTILVTVGIFLVLKINRNDVKELRKSP